MDRPEEASPADRHAFSIRFNLFGFIVFCTSLIAATGGLVLASLRSQEPSDREVASAATVLGGRETTNAPSAVPPWGEMIAYDMELEHPDEYSTSEYDNAKVSRWVFDGLRLEQVRAVMLRCGLSSNQIRQALSPHCAIETATNTIVQPEAELTLSLLPVVRGNLYSVLATSPANYYMCYPACFPGDSFESTMYGSRVDGAVISLIRPLLYKRGEAMFFSDFEFVMARVPTESQRLALMRALSRQPGVLVRLRIRPTTDIDRLLGYWAAPGVRRKDLRPFLESVKRMPDGGTVSLLYFLPPFARERLYTFPMPPKDGDPKMDCHWSAMNFFNEVPDDRFSDPAYVSQRLLNDYYPVQRPSNYGDVIVLADDRGEGIHSAVYIADDIVFTKNGDNYVQPWMLMRLDNLVAKYSVRGTPRLLVYRNKNS